MPYIELKKTFSWYIQTYYNKEWKKQDGVIVAFWLKW